MNFMDMLDRYLELAEEVKNWDGGCDCDYTRRSSCPVCERQKIRKKLDDMTKYMPEKVCMHGNDATCCLRCDE